MPPPVPPPPSNEALNGALLDPLDQWQPSASRFIHQQVSEGRQGLKLPEALGLKELVWQRLLEPGEEWAQGKGEGPRNVQLPHQTPREGGSDQVLITCLQPERGNSLVRLAVSSSLLGVTRTVPFPLPGRL